MTDSAPRQPLSPGTVSIARSSIATFCNCVILDDRTGDRFPDILDIHTDWHAMCQHHPRLVLWTPDDTGAASQLIVGRTLFELGHKAGAKILIACSTGKGAEALVARCRDLITGSENLKQIFPMKLGHHQQGPKFSITGLPNKPTSQPNVRGIGPDTQPESTVKYDLILMYDVVTRDTSDTPAKRANLMEWFRYCERMVRADTGKIMLVGHPLHKEDLYGQLIGSGLYVHRRYVIRKKNGTPTIPQVWPAERIEASEKAANATIQTQHEWRRMHLSEMPQERPPEFCDPTFPQQSAFIDDPARLKILFGSRRMGKSYALARYLLKVAWSRAGTDCLYIALTRDSAKKAIWKNALKELDRQLNLQIAFNENDLTATLPNGSVIYVIGAEASDAVRDRIRGGKYELVVVDEAASFNDLRELYFKILKPAVADYRGTICLTGTPGDVKAGIFFDLTKDHDAEPICRWTATDQETASEWSGHRWDTYVNPYMRKQEEEEVGDMVKTNPHIEETPIFQQERKGRWFIDRRNLVYYFDPAKNLYGGILPSFVDAGRDGRWHYVMGVDLGHSPDPTAFGIGAYHDLCDTLFFIEGMMVLEADLTTVADHIKDYEKRYEFDMKVIDGAYKQGVAELNSRLGVTLQAAEKADKFFHIDLMNADLIGGKVKLHDRSFPPIANMEEKYPSAVRQYANLVLDPRDQARGKRSEHPRCRNDYLDALLYIWRHCYQYLSRTPVALPKLGTPEWLVHEQDRMLEQDERTAIEQDAQIQAELEQTTRLFGGPVRYGAPTFFRH